METKRTHAEASSWIGFETLGKMVDRTTSGRTPADSKRPLFEPGQRLQDDRFTIVEVLGSGGEGVVYRATDSVRGRDVALKILHVEEGASRAQLKREFRFLRNLIHPGLVHLHELFVGPGPSFFTMSLVEGRTFLEAARDHYDLRQLLLQLAEVLVFLHGTGRLHRDIKPTNILVDGLGDLILVDFGVALDLRVAEDSDGWTGTLRYLAPEVFRGAPASPKSDAFSVGVLLYEALTGRFPPLPGDLDQTLAPPSRWVSDVPEDLEELCLALLDPEPERRAGVEHILERLGGDEWGTSPGRSSTRRTEDRFTGRERELQRLEAARVQMLDESGTVVALVEGPSGIGKSAFLDRFLSFHPRALRLRGVCSEHELVPHKALDGAMEDLAGYLAGCDTERLLELIPPNDARALVQLFPELRGVRFIDQLIPASGVVDIDPRTLLHQGYEAFKRVLMRLGRTEQVLLVIDDLQWGDLDSARLLLETLGGKEQPRCLLVLAFRSEEAKNSVCVQTLLEGNESLTDRLRSLRIQLEPLDGREARTLLSRFTQGSSLPGAALDEILAEAKGFPLLVTELVSQWSLERPNTDDGRSVGVNLSTVVEERLSTLSDAEQLAFSLLCAAGTLLDTDLLASICELDGDEMAMQLDSHRLTRSRQGGRKIQVLHDAIREARVKQLGDDARPLHRRLADELVRRQGEPAQIARHYEQCGELALASIWAERAAALASQSLALGGAVEFHRLALRGEPPGTERHRQLSLALARALADAGYGQEAAPSFAALAESASPEDAIVLRQRAAAQWLASGDVERGWNEIRRVTTDVGLAWPEGPRRAIWQVVVHRAAAAFRPHNAPTKPSTQVPRQDLLQLSACRAAWSVAYVSAVHGAANAARYLDLALRSRSAEHLGLAFGMDALFRATSGTSQTKQIEANRKRSEELLPRPLDNYGRAFLHYMYGQSNYLLGRLKECIRPYELAEEALALCRDVAWELSSSRTFWGSALNFLGRHRELDRRLVGWIRDARERNDLYGLTSFEILRLRRRCLAEGDHQAILRELDEAVAAWRSPYVGVHYSLAALTRGHVYTSWGRPDATLVEMATLRRGIESSLLSRVQVVRVTRAQVEVVAAVAQAVKTRGHQREEMLQLASTGAAALRAEKAAWASAFALHAEANVAFLRRRDEASLDALERAQRAYEVLGFEMNAAALSAAIGRIIGGDAGAERYDQALQTFRNADSDPTCGAFESFAPQLVTS
jgi:tetratricopeptide (TPR) repeat protein